MVPEHFGLGGQERPPGDGDISAGIGITRCEVLGGEHLRKRTQLEQKPGQAGSDKLTQTVAFRATSLQPQTQRYGPACPRMC